jgi:hypothetical protein
MYKAFQEMNAATNTELNIRPLKYTSETAKLQLTLNFLNKHWASSYEYKTISIFMKGSNCNNDKGISFPNLTYAVYAKIISIRLKETYTTAEQDQTQISGYDKIQKVPLVYFKFLQVIHRLHPSFKPVYCLWIINVMTQ